MKYIFLSVLLFCYTGKSFAQISKQEIGSEVGIVAAEVSGIQPPNNVIPNYGISVSIVGQYNFTDLFSIKSGLGFVEKGYATTQVLYLQSNIDPKTGFTGNSGNINNYYPTSYIELPILAKATFGKKIKFFANAGPYFGLLLIAMENVSVNETNQPPKSFSNNVTEYYKRVDMGICFGAGVEMPVKDKILLSLELRYDQGLMNVANTPPNNVPGVFGSQPVVNGAFSLLLGFRYRITD